MTPVCGWLRDEAKPGKPGPTCPSWCVDHSLSDETTNLPLHRGFVRVGEIQLELEWDTCPSAATDMPAVAPPYLTWVNGKELDDLIEALQLAREVIAKG